MLRFVRVLSVVLVSFLFVTAVVAQQQANLNDVQKQLASVGQMVVGQLKITDAQKASFSEMAGQMKQSCKAISSSGDGDEVKLNKMQTLVDANIHRVAGILTEKQINTALALGSAMLDMYGSGNGVVLSGAEIKGYMVKTGLASSKADAIVDVLRNHCESAKALSNQSLTERDLDSKLNALRAGTLAMISTKLDTDEQKTMGMVLKACQHTAKTANSCINPDQQVKALAFVNKLLRFAEENIQISKS